MHTFPTHYLQGKFGDGEGGGEEICLPYVYNNMHTVQRIRSKEIGEFVPHPTVLTSLSTSICFQTLREQRFIVPWQLM